MTDPRNRVRPSPTARSIPEWVGATPDAEIPRRVRARVFDRFGGVCQISGRKITASDRWECDHIKRLRDGGAHAETNLQPVLVEAHRMKSAVEVSDGAKADRIRAKHLGIFPKSKRPLKSRGFSPSREAGR
jgi:5-methylcytosine-specific restriction enzyme A